MFTAARKLRQLLDGYNSAAFDTNTGKIRG